jgi:osmotically-inducible protein OsmY
MRLAPRLIGLVAVLAAMSACVIVVEGEGDVDATWASSYSSTDADEALAQKVGENLDADPELRTEDLRVDVRRGVVTLRGEVSDLQSLEKAISKASSVEGVRRVVSKLTVEVAPT